MARNKYDVDEIMGNSLMSISSSVSENMWRPTKRKCSWQEL